jgi:hydroxyacylglutathione hydrolase
MNTKYMRYKFDNNIEIYRFEFSLINSNMYLLYKDNSALIIDPHITDDLNNILEKNKIENITIILTHEHPDHTSGVNYLVENYKVYLICQEACANLIGDKRNNRPTLISFVMAEKDKKENKDTLSKVYEYFNPYTCKADVVFKEKLECQWCNFNITMISTPGHSKGSCCIILDNNFVFTGDSLLKDEPIIVRFKGGCIDEYKKITLPFLYSLKLNLYVLPGHGKVFKLSKKILDNLKFN